MKTLSTLAVSFLLFLGAIALLSFEAGCSMRYAYVPGVGTVLVTDLCNDKHIAALDAARTATGDVKFHIDGYQADGTAALTTANKSLDLAAHYFAPALPLPLTPPASTQPSR